MDFGKILAAWEAKNTPQAKEEARKKKSQMPSVKKPNAPTKEEKEAAIQQKTFAQIAEEENAKTVNPIELWLEKYGTVDKDAEIVEANERAKLEDRSYLRTMAPEARIDLHGLTKDQAIFKLGVFVEECVRKNLKKILIIHGKGNHTHGSDPVLGQTVRNFIETNPHLGTSGHPDRTMGGTGATWVILK